jgi:hypothetical protein
MSQNENEAEVLSVTMDETCAVCGKHLNATNRSSQHPDTCKGCAGEEDDQNDTLDDFK